MYLKMLNYKNNFKDTALKFDAHDNYHTSRLSLKFYNDPVIK